MMQKFNLKNMQKNLQTYRFLASLVYNKSWTEIKKAIKML